MHRRHIITAMVEKQPSDNQLNCNDEPSSKILKYERQKQQQTLLCLLVMVGFCVVSLALFGLIMSSSSSPSLSMLQSLRIVLINNNHHGENVLASHLQETYDVNKVSTKTKEEKQEEIEDDNKIEEDYVIIPDLAVGETSKLYWRSDGKVVDKDARFIGLPPQLTQEVQNFVEKSGLADLFMKLGHGEPLQSRETKVFRLNDGQLWTAMGPQWSNSKREKGNVHWYDVGDEESYEETMKVLGRGDLDIVMDAISHEYKSEGWMMDGMGFVGCSYYSSYNLHMDSPGQGTKFANLLFPIILPEDDAGTVYLVDDEDIDRIATLNYTPNVGILLGGDTMHGTGRVDYRSNKELRVVVSLYLVDINKDNLEEASSDATGIFPTPNDLDYAWAQKGRIWDRINGNTLKNDKGRKPYEAYDNDDACPTWAGEGRCDTDPFRVRLKCPKSCKVYIDDERYFTEFFPNSNRGKNIDGAIS